MSTDYARWQDVAELHIEDPEFRGLTEKAMDDLWAIPEMRQLMISARANSGGEKLQISNTTSMPSSFFNLGGTLNLNPEDLVRTSFRSEDGDDIRASLTHVLVHEYFHAADPINNTLHARNEMLGYFGRACESVFVEMPEGELLNQLPRSHALLRAVADLSGDPGLIALSRGNFSQYEHGTAELYFESMQEALAAIAEDPIKLRALERHMNLPEGSLVIAPEEVIKERWELAGKDFADRHRPREDEHGTDIAERNATDWTDYIMGRYFNEPARREYSNGDLIDEGPLFLSTPAFTPTGQRFDYVHIGETPMQYAPQGGLPTTAEILAEVDLSWARK